MKREEAAGPRFWHTRTCRWPWVAGVEENWGTQYIYRRSGRRSRARLGRRNEGKLQQAMDGVTFLGFSSVVFINGNLEVDEVRFRVVCPSVQGSRAGGGSDKGRVEPLATK